MKDILKFKTIEEVRNNYPYTVCLSWERTSTMDGSYNKPMLAKSFDDAYEYLKEIFQEHMEECDIDIEELELNKIYKRNDEDRPNYISFQSLFGLIEQNQDEYYLNSREKALETGNVWKTPDLGMVYTGHIYKQDVEEEHLKELITIGSESIWGYGSDNFECTNPLHYTIVTDKIIQFNCEYIDYIDVTKHEREYIRHPKCKSDN